jgi:leucyl aminopeptidase
MRLEVTAAPLASVKDEAVVLLAREGDDVARDAALLGKGFAGPLATLGARKPLATAAGKGVALADRPRSRVRMLVVAGADPVEGDPLEGLRKGAGHGVRLARDGGARSVTLVLPRPGRGRPATEVAAKAVAEGALTGLYRFEAHKSKPSETAVEALSLLVPRGEAARAERGVRAGEALAAGVAVVRDLGNEPGNRATPTFLAETARRIAETEGLAVKVLEEADMERLGMGSLLGVAKGSAEPAKLVILTYEPKGKRARDTVALVGKGLTFDTGGISIKPAAKLEDMKFDMCGGAAVLGALQTAARLRVKTRVVGLVPASENMPGGAAYKPGDILKAMNGTTIEVRNTDAEGRLILADALSYATTKMTPRPKAVIDLATLTGACVVALGDQHAGLVSTDDRLARRIEIAAERSGDRVWRLPLVEGHRKQLESPYADVSNLGTPGAGALTAAAFLEKFVHGVPWAHLDIAGMAWGEKVGPTTVPGATGFGVRLLAELLEAW